MSVLFVIDFTILMLIGLAFILRRTISLENTNTSHIELYNSPDIMIHRNTFFSILSLLEQI